jgi:tetratricopeptide (TPR) repeat protein
MTYKYYIKQTVSCVVALGGILGLASCSQYSNSFTSRAYHNTTAKFNAYVQAKDLMTVSEQTIFKNYKDDFSSLLPILIPLDSTQNGAAAQAFDAIYKKASLVVERHQNSKWTDDAYLLIAKVRMYQEKYTDAIETFKYVNSPDSDDDARHAALVYLMRTYIESGDENSALRVAEYMRELPLNKINTRDYYLTKAYLHEIKGEYDISVATAEEALKLMKKGEYKARVHFAVAQMYGAIGQTEKSIEHFKAVQKNNPNYDLSFNAGINALLSDGEGVAKVQNSFSGMLADRKNSDLRDRIYLAMAQRELSQKNYTQAVKSLQAAIRNANGNQKTLSQSYLALANVHYDQFQQYELAKAYYDSALTTTPPKDPTFATIEAKKKTLDEFVKQITIVRTEDSLQTLAQMNPLALDRLLDKLIADKEKKIAENLALAQKIVNGSSGMLTRNESTEVSSFYFYNPTIVSQGKSDFIRKWGNRKLEDNWQRSTKDASIFADNTPSASNGSLNVSKGSVANKDATLDRKAQKEELMRNIPFGQAELATSKSRQEDAYLKLGKIYKLDLNEPDNARKTFEKLLIAYPQTKYEAEVLYLLCLLNENQPAYTGLKEKLMTKHGDSYFARLLNRGNTILAAGADAEAQRLYANGYELYQKGNYNDAMVAMDNGLRNFPNSSIDDKFAFMKTLLLAKTQQVALYKQYLNNFLKDYPRSNLTERVKEMMAVAEK